MNSFTIIADSGCDMSVETLAKWNVKGLDLTMTFDGDKTTYTNKDISSKQFYDRMRNGEIARTSAINMQTFKDYFDKELAGGSDIFYLGFSTGLSATYNYAKTAAEELSEKYPERKIITIDSLCASAGYGLLLYLAVQKRDSGASIEETAEYINSNLMNVCHWFTVDDLVYLKRGGRVSAAVALLGGVLGIKPVLHMDNEGKLINMSKTRGRKASIKALADKYGELAIEKGAEPVFISHGDCRDDAQALADILKKEYGAKVDMIADIGSVIGAHSGPGTLALFFLGRER